MLIRKAQPTNAVATCDVLRRSITRLCTADHRDDPAALAAWLANKTAEAVASWIAAPGNHVLVAEDGGAILGVGSVTDAGRIGLNYVAPEARFRGVSKAMLRALENHARSVGAARCTLESTETARRFYRASGYHADGAPIPMLGAHAWPMAKSLDQ